MSTDDEWKRMLKVVENFLAMPDCVPFREPVDWKGMGLTDYPIIVKKPMDLGTIKKKIKKKEYGTIQEAADDVQLVWKNCMTYNQDGSDFYKLATNLKRKFDTQYGKIVKLDASPETAASAAAVSDVTLQDKRAMAKLLYQVTKEDLGKALVEIERKCSDAIQRNAKEDQIELNIDCLSGELVRELTKTLQEMIAVSGKRKPSAPKTKRAKTSATPAQAKADS